MQTQPTTVADPEWTLIVSFLYWGGERFKSITNAQHLAARRLADGFGPGVEDLDLLWDWSHVRDSSPAAVAAVATYLGTIAGATSCR